MNTSNMTNTPLVDNLGKKGWNDIKKTCVDTFPVRVRRQDSTIENVKLMDELVKFLDTEMPDAVSKYFAYPQFYKYDQDALQHFQGFPEEACKVEDRLRKGWREKALGDSSEAETFWALETLFQSRPSLLLTGVKTVKILRVARETAEYSLDQSKKENPHMFSVPLTVEEKMLAEALGVDLLQLENEILDLITLITSDSHKPSISQKDLELLAQLASMNLVTVKPGFSLLKDSEKSRYNEILAGAVNRMLCKSKRDMPKNEVANDLTRLFLGFEKNDEFDFLAADRSSSTFLQLEVKSYPQVGVPNNEGLRKALEKANEQLGKGDKFYDNVLAPAAQLSSSWTKLNFVCFPKIPNRQQFRDLGVDDNALKFVLTTEELQSSKWFEDLSLPDCQAAEEEYKRLLAVCVGSQHLAFNCQMFDNWEEHQNTQAQLVGEVDHDKVAGIGGEEGPMHGASSISHLDLKSKPIGHTWSILFWTQEQLGLLESLKSGKNAVLCGDYGTGKTSLLVYAALEATRDPNTKVVFITATKLPPIHVMDREPWKRDYVGEEGNVKFVLDEAMRVKFEGTTVEVVNIEDLRKLHGGHAGYTRRTGDDTHPLIRDFVKAKTQPVKVFIDELHVHQNDWKDVIENGDTELTDTLKILEKHSLQTWIALSTLSLLDIPDDLPEKDIKRLNELSTRTHLVRQFTTRTSFELKHLELRMRNSSSIGESVPDEISKFKKGAGNLQTSIIGAASSTHTVVGIRPIFLNEPRGFLARLNFWGISTPEIILKEVLSKFLKLEAHPREHAVILCGHKIPIPEVSEAAIKIGYRPITYSQPPTDEERVKLCAWLRGTGGLLVTSNLQFAGMEASTCVFITNNIVKEIGARSGLLRATARLVVVSFTPGIDREEILGRFLVKETNFMQRKSIRDSTNHPTKCNLTNHYDQIVERNNQPKFWCCREIKIKFRGWTWLAAWWNGFDCGGRYLPVDGDYIRGRQVGWILYFFCASVGVLTFQRTSQILFKLFMENWMTLNTLRYINTSPAGICI